MSEIVFAACALVEIEVQLGASTAIMKSISIVCIWDSLILTPKLSTGLMST